jgi:hypothetical protein
MSNLHGPERQWLLEPRKSASPWKCLAGVGTFLATILGLQLLPVAVRVQLYIGLVAGILVGLLPLFLGRKRQQKKLGGVALLSCAVSGAAMGLLLALPVALVFTAVIWRRKPLAVESRGLPP